MVKELATHFTHTFEPAITKEVSELSEDLYESAFAVKAFAESYHSNGEKYAYTVFDGAGRARHVLLFEKVGKKVNVINQLCHIENAFVEMFCRACFDRFPEVNVIGFTNCYVEPEIESFAWYITFLSDDYIIHLPDTIKEYRSRLSRKLKDNLNSGINRSKRDFPDFEFVVLEKNEIPRSIIEMAAELNKQRMKEKGGVSGLSEEEVESLYQRTRDHGYATYVKMDGRIVSISINTVVGEHLYGHVNAHDSKYNYYSLGLITLYQNINSFIERGGREFHTLWGEYSYKSKFQAEMEMLYSFEVLRHGYMKKWLIFLNRVHHAKVSLKDKVKYLRSLTFQQALRVISKKTGEYLRQHTNKEGRRR